MATLDDLVYNFNRELIIIVKVNGVLLQGTSTSLDDDGVPAVDTLRMSKSLDSPSPVCDIGISHLSSWIRRGQPVTVDIGYVGAIARRVFTGYVQSRERKVAGAMLRCAGRSFSLFRTTEMEPFDVTGKTATTSISTILKSVGVTHKNVDVTIGQLNTSGQEEMVLENMGAAQMVQTIYELDGSRLFETNFGVVNIRPMEEIPAPTALYSYSTTTQSTAIVLGGSDREDANYFKNKVVVTGINITPEDAEAEPITGTALLVDDGGLIQPPMPADTRIVFPYSNQLIDVQSWADDLALILLNRYARIPRYLTLEIAGDPRLEIGQTIGLDFPHMGIGPSRWFVSGVAHNVSNDATQGFRTTLTLRGGDQIGGTLDIAPIATFEATAEVENMGGVEVTVFHFDASGSYDPDGTIDDPDGYVWTSNQPITIPNGSNVTVTADTAGWVGDFEVTLTTTDNDGGSASSSQIVPYGNTTGTVIPAIYAAINNNASASLDGSKTWRNWAHSTTISVAARPADGVNFGHGLWGDTTGHIYRSTDGLSTAPTLVYTTVAGVAINDIQWDWRNANVCWAIDENAIVYISVDAGVTWTIYKALRSVTYTSGAATPAALGNKIGMPAAGGIYAFGGTGSGEPLIAYDPIVGSQGWVHQQFTGDLLTDTVTTPGDATLRIVDAVAAGGLLGAHIILSWASGGGASITAVYYSTSTPGPSAEYSRATTTFGGLKTGRFVVQNTTTAYCAFANRSVWRTTNGLDWTETTNVFPANTTPWHAIWLGLNQGLTAASVFFIALQDTVAPNNGYIMKSTDGFATAVAIRPTTGTITNTWPASAIGKKLAIGAAGTTVPGNNFKIVLIKDSGGVTNTDVSYLVGTNWTTIAVPAVLASGGSSSLRPRLYCLTASDWLAVGTEGFPQDDLAGVAAATNSSGGEFHEFAIGDEEQASSDEHFGITRAVINADRSVIWGVRRRGGTNGDPIRIEVFKSVDNLNSWQFVTTLQAAVSSIRYVFGMMAHPTNKDIISVVSVMPDQGATDNRTIVWTTFNGGGSWDLRGENTSVASGNNMNPAMVSSDTVQSHQFLMLQNGRIIAFHSPTSRGAEDTKCYTSDDYGDTWVLRQTIPHNGGNCLILAGASSNKIVAYYERANNVGTINEEAYVSTNQGNSYEAVGVILPRTVTPGTVSAKYHAPTDTLVITTGTSSTPERVWTFTPVDANGVWTDVSYNLPGTGTAGRDCLQVVAL